MKAKIKTWLFNVIRLLIAVAALWFVTQGVTLDDHLWLAQGERELVGTITGETPESVTMVQSNGERAVVLKAEIAKDEKDQLRVTYGVKSAWRQSSKGFLLLSLLIFMPVPVLQGIRLNVLLRGQGIRLGLWTNIKLAFAGNFANFVAPTGSTAGDVIKAYWLSLHTQQKTAAITTMFFDRVSGLVGLLLVVAVVSTLARDESPLAWFRLYSIGLLVAGVIGATIFVSPWLREKFTPKALMDRIPRIDFFRRIDSAAVTLIRRPAIWFTAVLLTVLLQGVAVISYVVVAVALDMHVTWDNSFEYYAYFATGCIIQALPGPPQGLGTVELAYRIFFSAYGTASQIVCLALAIRIIAFTASFPGLGVWLTGAYGPSSSNNRIKQSGEVNRENSIEVSSGNQSVAKVPLKSTQLEA